MLNASDKKDFLEERPRKDSIAQSQFSQNNKAQLLSVSSIQAHAWVIAAQIWSQASLFLIQMGPGFADRKSWGHFLEDISRADVLRNSWFIFT